MRVARRACTAFDATAGAPLWSTPVDPVAPTPVVGDDGLVYVVGGQTLVALDPADGSIAWTAQLSKAAVGGIAFSPPAVSDGSPSVVGHRRGARAGAASNRDRHIDAGLNRTSSKLSVLVQQPDGTMAPTGVPYSSWDSPDAVELADMDRDGRLDVVVLHGGAPSFGVYEQEPDGTLADERLTVFTGDSHHNPHGLALGDGSPDVVAASQNSGLVVVPNNAPAPPGGASRARQRWPCPRQARTSS